jgi:beta-fructofuranosidase
MMDNKNAQKLKIEQAMAVIKKAALVADSDQSRPEYHFHAPAQWMDDPNGIIYHRGYYHMMYSLNPHSSEHRAGMVYKTGSKAWDPEDKDWTGGITVWGHARSKDLVHWEHLPIALYPSPDKGEHYIWFGCTVINDEGVPMAIYTSIGPEKRPEDTADQWAAMGDPDLITWEPLPSNPLISDRIHGNQKILEWRDPFVFKESGRTFMILGGKLEQENGGDAVVVIYEAENKAYSSWKYRGILFRYPDKNLRSVECPNIAKIGEKWVLLISPHGAVEYFIGKLDLQDYKFVPEHRGIVDRSTNFYATNVLYDDQDRCLMWGCIEGFTRSKGWNGCLSLPRVLEITTDGLLAQKPVSELMKLRGAYSAQISRKLQNETHVLTKVSGNTFEMMVEFERTAAATFGIKLKYPEQEIVIACHGDVLEVAGIKVPVSKDMQSISLHVFIDKSVIELYVNGNECVTRVISICSNECEVAVFASQGEVKMNTFDLWELKTAELFSSNY